MMNGLRRKLATAARPIIASAVLAAALLAVVACGVEENGGGGTSSSAPATPTATESASPGATASPAPGEVTAVNLYFLRDGMIGVAHRVIPATTMPATAALTALLEGPERRERAAGLSTAIPSQYRLDAVAVNGGTAFVDLQSDALYKMSSETARQLLGQVVYTVTQFPTVDGAVVTLNGNQLLPSGETGTMERLLTRADFEDVTPSVLVESPAVGDSVSSPLTITGTANTFEATFMAEVLDTNGAQLAPEKMITATSGTGERGTFSAELSFTMPDVMSGDGSAAADVVLVVYETSAEDGSRIHEVRIPLTVAP
jgi:spore germination protein GerM